MIVMTIMLLFSTDCEDLIKQMLTVDCHRRISIEQIISHPWMQQGEDDFDFLQLIREFNMQSFDDPDTENLNDTVLDQCEMMHSMDREKVIEVCCCQTLVQMLCVVYIIKALSKF